MSWTDLTKRLKDIGIHTAADGVGNYGFSYNGYHLGGYTDGDPYVTFATDWKRNDNDKYSFASPEYIMSVDTKKYKCADFDKLSDDEVINIITDSLKLLKAKYPQVDRIPQTLNGPIRSSRFIVFEGIDNSGKTTVSKRVAEMMPWFTWTKEPAFSTEEADRLNSDEFKGKDAKREVFFLESRLKQQLLYRSSPCLLDRYLWTGIAYVKAFSPSIYEFCAELYTNHNIFMKPDLVFFMETPIDKCYDREPKLKKEPGRLERIRQAYSDTENLVSSPIVYIDGNMGIEECAKFCADEIVRRFPDQEIF
jgi:dTMP kinase